MNDTDINFKLKTIPKMSGVYLMRDNKGKIVYIGKAKNLYSRIRSYFFKNEDFRIVGLMFYNIKNIDYIVCGSEKEALILEQRLIKKIQPQYNIVWRDDKSYLMLEIDLEDPFPRLNFIRYKEYLNNKDKKKLYFGPYPSSTQIKYLVKFILKYFKIRRCKYNSQLFFNSDLKNKFMSCIYYQTNQCIAPCVKLHDGNKKEDVKKDYKIFIKNIILFLQGKNKNLILQLEKQMKWYSKNLNFEQAIVLRNVIKAVSNIFSKCIIKKINAEDIEEYAIKKLELLKKLKEKLNLRQTPVIIEAIDISTFQGVGSCGSVVKFLNGEPLKNEYRRYKIKTLKGYVLDDYSMMREVIERRYTKLIKEKKELPNLLIVDGGKGQFNIALDILKRYDLDKKIDLISIAKQEEIVYSVNLQPFKLTNEPEDNLLKFIRDEAHRFALKYNKILVKKKIVK